MQARSSVVAVIADRIAGARCLE